MPNIDVIVQNAIKNAPKSQDGSITRKDGIKLLQNIFKQDNGVVAMKKTKNEKRDYEGVSHSASESWSGCAINNVTGFGYGYGYGFGGFLSQTKDLFDLYMDIDSEGGGNITKAEQQSIIETVKNWVRDLNKLNNNL